MTVSPQAATNIAIFVHNSTQFSSNNLRTYIKSGAPLTNLFLFGDTTLVTNGTLTVGPNVTLYFDPGADISDTNNTKSWNFLVASNANTVARLTDVSNIISGASLLSIFNTNQFTNSGTITFKNGALVTNIVIDSGVVLGDVRMGTASSLTATNGFIIRDSGLTKNWNFKGVADSNSVIRFRDKDFVNVKDPPWNAAGDGSTDDTAALQAVANQIRANGGGKVIFPPGNYKFSSVPLFAFTNISNISIEGLGATLTSTTSSSAMGVFDFNSCTNITISNLKFVSPDILPQGTGNVFVVFSYGTKNVLVQNISTYGGLVGVGANGQIQSLGYDTNRVNGVTVLNYNAFGTYYPINWYGDGLFVRGLKTVNCGRSAFVANSRTVDIEVDSEHGGPFTDVLLKAYVSTNYWSGLDNIRVKYRALSGRYLQASNQSSEEAYVALEAQMQDTGTNYASIGNVFVEFDTDENSTKPSRGAFTVRKFDSGAAFDATGRGHRIRNLTLSGVVRNAQLMLDTPVRLFTASVNNWTGDYISGVSVKDMRIECTTANNALEIDGRGIVTNSLPGITVRNVFSEGEVVASNIRNIEDVSYENVSFDLLRSYNVQNQNTNVTIRSPLTVTGTGLFQDFVRVTGNASLSSEGTVMTLARSGTVGTIYTGDGTGYTTRFASRTSSVDTPLMEYVEGYGFKMYRPTYYVGLINAGTITSSQNNWNPASLGTANVVRVASDASRDITGLQTFGGMDGRQLIIHNIGSQNIVLKDESASSNTTNRFALFGDITLSGDESVELWYDDTSKRWRTDRGYGKLSQPTFASVIISGLTSSNMLFAGASSEINQDTDNTFRYDDSGNVLYVNALNTGNGANELYAMDQNVRTSDSVSFSGVTSILTPPAGTATAGTAPLKLQNGTLLSTPETGAIEMNGNSLYYTLGGPVRVKVHYGFTGNLTWNPGSISADNYLETTTTITGALTTHAVSVGMDSAMETGLIVSAWVSASDTVTVRVNNTTGSPVDPANRIYYLKVIY